MGNLLDKKEQDEMESSKQKGYAWGSSKKKKGAKPTLVCTRVVLFVEFASHSRGFEKMDYRAPPLLLLKPSFDQIHVVVALFF